MSLEYGLDCGSHPQMTLSFSLVDIIYQFIAFLFDPIGGIAGAKNTVIW